MRNRAIGLEFTMRKTSGVRGYHERKIDVVRGHHLKGRWGKSSPKERAMG